MGSTEKHVRRLVWTAMWLAASFAHVAQADAVSRAAHAGQAQAQYALALRYEQGDGAAPNPALALQWTRRAALQGHAAAQNNLGALYFDRGNFRQALHWYQRAALKGHADAQFNLALLYELGRGVPPQPRKSDLLVQIGCRTRALECAIQPSKAV